MKTTMEVIKLEVDMRVVDTKGTAALNRNPVDIME